MSLLLLAEQTFWIGTTINFYFVTIVCIHITIAISDIVTLDIRDRSKSLVRGKNLHSFHYKRFWQPKLPMFGEASPERNCGSENGSIRFIRPNKFDLQSPPPCWSTHGFRKHANAKIGPHDYLTFSFVWNTGRTLERFSNHDGEYCWANGSSNIKCSINAEKHSCLLFASTSEKNC